MLTDVYKRQLDDNVYIQYKNDEDYYGVLDLSGKKYIDASKKEYREKFVVYGKYLYNYKENGGRKMCIRDRVKTVLHISAVKI